MDNYFKVNKLGVPVFTYRHYLLYFPIDHDFIFVIVINNRSNYCRKINENMYGIRIWKQVR